MSKPKVPPKPAHQQATKNKPGDPPAAPPTLSKVSKESPQAVITAECLQVANAAVHLADAVEAFAGEQWRYHHDLWRELGKIGPSIGDVFKIGERAQELEQRKTVLGAASWYLAQRADELFEKGSELRRILLEVKDVFPKPPAKRKAVA
jgi:hypothetical protein